MGWEKKRARLQTGRARFLEASEKGWTGSKGIIVQEFKLEQVKPGGGTVRRKDGPRARRGQFMLENMLAARVSGETARRSPELTR